MPVTLPHFQSALERATWVQGVLKLKGSSLSKLAKQAGYKRQSMSQTMYQPNARLEPIIAQAVGTTVQELFPERFDTVTGERLHVVRQDRHVSCHDNANSGVGA